MSKKLHWQSIWALCWALIGLLHVLQVAGQVEDVKSQINGWIDIDFRDDPSEQFWPLEADQYFIAMEKRHHFISVTLPVEPLRDLDVKLEFYYNYKRLRPTIQFVPCTEFFQIEEAIRANETLGAIEKKQWLRHEYRVKAADCLNRNELQYDILLHDANDVFAFRKMSVKYVDPPVEATTATSPSSSEQTQANATSSLSTESGKQPEAQSEATDVSQANETVPVAEEGPTPAPVDEPPTSDVTPDNSTTTPTSQSTVTGESTAPTSTIAPPTVSEVEVTSKTTPTTPEPTSIPGATKGFSFDVPSVVGSESIAQTSPQTETMPNTASSASSTTTSTTSPNPTPASTTNSNPNSDPQAPYNLRSRSSLPPSSSSERSRRKKRFAETAASQVTPREINEVCTPKKCDRKVFEVSARFISIVEALPSMPHTLERSSSRSLYKLNGKPQPLEWLLELKEDSFKELDACINLNLFMDANCTLDMVLGPETAKSVQHSNQSSSVERLLETFRSDKAEWHNIERCMSSYMPKYEPLADQRADQTMRLTFRPTKAHPSDRIIVLTDKNNLATLREPYRAESFIPSNRYLHDGETNKKIDNFWVLESDSLRKPKMGFENVSIASTSEQTTGTLKTSSNLSVYDIDLNQSSFALTSRWLKGDELNSDGHIVLNYFFSDEDWLKEVHLDSQLTKSAWSEEMVYIPPRKASEEAATSANDTSTGKNITSQKELGMLRIKERIYFSRPYPRDYRIRLRHIIDRKDGVAASLNNKLKISLLSLGDGCAGMTRCFHGGKCKPIGPHEIECICQPGYSGKLCDKINSCDVIHLGDLSGREICKKFGAVCIENIPELRCVWPNDKYTQCNSTEYFKIDANVQASGDKAATDAIQKVDEPGKLSVNGSTTDPTTEEKDLKTSPLTEGKEAANEKQKSLIIMCLLMIAATIFFAVLLLNLLMRLRKSKDKLEQSELQLYEMSRRFQQQPTTSAGSVMTGRVRGQGTGQTSKARVALPPVAQYQNNAFDLE